MGMAVQAFAVRLQRINPADFNSAQSKSLLRGGGGHQHFSEAMDSIFRAITRIEAGLNYTDLMINKNDAERGKDVHKPSYQNNYSFLIGRLKENEKIEATLISRRVMDFRQRIDPGREPGVEPIFISTTIGLNAGVQGLSYIRQFPEGQSIRLALDTEFGLCTKEYAAKLEFVETIDGRTYMHKPVYLEESFGVMGNSILTEIALLEQLLKGGRRLQ